MRLPIMPVGLPRSFPCSLIVLGKRPKQQEPRRKAGVIRIRYAAYRRTVDTWITAFVSTRGSARRCVALCMHHGVLLMPVLLKARLHFSLLVLF